MKLPSSEPKNFIMNLRTSLMGSMAQRAKDSANWQSLYYAGASIEQNTPAIANIITPRIDTKAGNLFSPDNLTFRLEYELDQIDPILQQAKRAASFVSRELRDADADLEFGDAVHLALIDGSSFGQLDWQVDGDDGHFAADVIPQACVGVLNEKAKGLYEQEAFMVSYSCPVESFEWWAGKFRGANDLASAFDRDGESKASGMGDVTKLVLGLNQPIGNPSASQAGFINLMPRAPYVPGANAAGRQLRIDAIWLKDSERNDWATVYVVEETNTIGTDRWHNFLGVKGRHPYFYVCPNPVKGSIFGRSAIADIAEPQGFIRRHSDDLDHILDMQADPAHIGYGATQTAETYKPALRSRGGWVTETNPNAKVTPFKPELPEGLIPSLELASGWASDSSGAPPVVQGRGEQGVRAGAHAETLMTAASARERRAAIRVLRQCGDMGDLGLEILKVKNAASLPDGKGGTFTLESLPDGYHVRANGYSASPIFAAEHRALVSDLLRSGAIGPGEALEMLNPEGIDMLQNALQKREEQQAEIIKSLPPEERVKLWSHRGGKR